MLDNLHANDKQESSYINFLIIKSSNDNIQVKALSENITTI